MHHMIPNFGHGAPSVCFGCVAAALNWGGRGGSFSIHQLLSEPVHILFITVARRVLGVLAVLYTKSKRRNESQICDARTSHLGDTLASCRNND